MKKYYVFLLFGVLAAIAVSAYLIVKMDSYLYKTEITKIEKSHQSIEDRIEDYISDKDTFLRMISNYVLVKVYLNDGDKSSLEETNTFFYNLVKGNEKIMQLRLIDNFGIERVKVDRTAEGKIVIVKKEKLQDKSNREYFKRFSKLDENVVELSDLDLNMEFGKIEVPWRPTLRAATPVFINGKRIGMVVVNYNMQHWLEDIAKLTSNNFYLVDSEGYFIVHPDDKWKWSRHQIPSKKVGDYFLKSNIDFLNLNINDSDTKVIDNVFVKKIIFFNNQTLFAIYEPNVPISELLIEKSAQVVFFIFLSFLLIIIPVIKLISVFIKNLNDEKESLRNTQEYISKIFDNAFDAIFVINSLGIIQKINLSAQKMFKYDESELIGKNINMLMPEPHSSNHNRYLRDNDGAEGSKTVVGIKNEIYALDKEKNEIPITISVTKMKQNNEVFFIGSIKDHTKLKLAKEKQREQEAMLLQQSKFAAMGEMLSAIAHQWRQPLNSIGLIIQDLVSAQKYGEFNKEYLIKSKDDIMNQVNLMSSTIDEFRNFFSKSNVVKSFNLLDSIDELHSLYWAQFKSNDISLEIICMQDKETDAYIIVNLQSELKQVLLNLLANAKDAIVNIQNSNAYERKITIVLDSREDEVQVDVCDNAGGIDDDVIKRIFEPYFTTKEMGTGLGLFIVKTIMEKNLKGTISCKKSKSEFENNTYFGTTFSVILPKLID